MTDKCLVLDGSCIGLNIRDMIENEINKQESLVYCSLGKFLSEEGKINSKIWLEFSKYLDNNILAPEDKTNKFFIDKIYKKIESKLVPVVYGYPRNMEQLKFLQKELSPDIDRYYLMSSDSSVKSFYENAWLNNKYSHVRKYYPTKMKVANYINSQIKLKNKLEKYLSIENLYKLVDVSHMNNHEIEYLIQSLLPGR